jgi:acetolactate synthase-1/2/3 large subunit
VQEIIKYGRGSGVELGPYDPVRYAEAFGATGLMITNADDIVPCRC